MQNVEEVLGRLETKIDNLALKRETDHLIQEQTLEQVRQIGNRVEQLEKWRSARELDAAEKKGYAAARNETALTRTQLAKLTTGIGAILGIVVTVVQVVIQNWG